MKNSAVFIAGDENIYFPALVAIESIRENNPGLFDYFICFNGSKLTPYMEKILIKKSIFFIDTQTLNRYGIIENFATMSEGHWPIDVFYNYVIPNYLWEKGYEYSYKADYDILCIAPYILQEIQPTNVAISGWSNRLNLTSPGVPQSVINKLVTDGFIRAQVVDYMNVGFVGFNNKIYNQNSMLNKFTEYYKLLFKLCPEAKLLEQIAFALLLESTDGKFLAIPESYNHRVLTTRLSDNNFIFDSKNIHYITRFKPWKKLEKDKFRWFIFNGGHHLFLYRNIWLEYAKHIDGFEYFCDQEPLTQIQMIGINMYAAQCFNEKIKSIKTN